MMKWSNKFYTYSGSHWCSFRVFEKSTSNIFDVWVAKTFNNSTFTPVAFHTILCTIFLRLPVSSRCSWLTLRTVYFRNSVCSLYAGYTPSSWFMRAMRTGYTLNFLDLYPDSRFSVGRSFLPLYSHIGMRRWLLWDNDKFLIQHR